MTLEVPAVPVTPELFGISRGRCLDKCFQRTYLDDRCDSRVESPTAYLVSRVAEPTNDSSPGEFHDGWLYYTCSILSTGIFGSISTAHEKERISRI